MQHFTVVLILFSVYALLVVVGAVSMLTAKKRKFLPMLVGGFVALSVFVFFEGTGFFRTPAFVLGLVFACVLLHTLVGEHMAIYHKSTTFDRWLHLVGTFTFALFIYSVIDNTIKPPAVPKAYLFIFVTALGIALGSVFEVYEYLHDKVTQHKPRLPTQHGLKDTDTDMLFNIVGAALAGLVALFLYA